MAVNSFYLLLVFKNFFFGFLLPFLLLLVAFWGLTFAAKKNIILNIICLEIIFAAVNFNLAYYSYSFNDAAGLIFVFFCLVIAGCEAAIGLSIILALYKRLGIVTADNLMYLKG